MRRRGRSDEAERLIRVLATAERLLAQFDSHLPTPGTAHFSGDGFTAFRCLASDDGITLKGVSHPHRIGLADLHCVETQKQELDRNTRQFLAGLPANNALLWGSRGTGKSSLVKALLHEYSPVGLRLIEVDKALLTHLPEIMERLEGRPERFILYCDDLSFEADESGYKTLKAVLDGSLSAIGGNVLVYATSNRRHLLPEYHHENLAARNVDGEIHQGEAVEEKISLSERFGIWLSFYPFTQDEYLEVVRHWLDRLGGTSGAWEEIRAEALRWALQRGSRSGRSAWQFARDWTGRQGLQSGSNGRSSLPDQSGPEGQSEHQGPSQPELPRTYS
jgi:predicted AAA+ superfamily ATPase